MTSAPSEPALDASVTPAGPAPRVVAALTVLCSLGLVAWMIAPAVQRHGLSVGVWVLFLSAVVIVSAIGGLAIYLLERVVGQTRRTFIVLAALGGIGVFLVHDHLYFIHLGTHLDLNEARVAFDAFNNDEIGLPWAVVARLAIGIATWLLLAPALLWVLGKARALNGERLVGGGVQVAVLVAVGVLVAMRTAWVPPHDPASVAVARLLPWEQTSERASGVATSLADSAEKVADNTIPLVFSDQTELAQVRALKKQRDKLLARPWRAKTKPNILFVHVESLRSDNLTAERMPRLWALSERCWRLGDHFSGGNNSGIGTWSFLSGLQSYYYQPSRTEELGPLPLDVLGKLGYRRKAWFSKDLRLWDKIFQRNFEGHVDDFFCAAGLGGGDQVGDERKLVGTFLDELRADKGDKPRFDYLVLFAPHYQYYYPPEFAKHAPTLDLGYTITCGFAENQKQHADKIRNRYRNAVAFADHQLGQVIDTLRDTGRLDDTVIVVSGDHGEEFWEKGRFGHSYGLNDEQIHVATTVCLPGRATETTRYRYTSHADFMPTVFDHMGVNPNVGDLTNGKSLLRHEAERDFALVGHGMLNDAENHEYVIVSEGTKLRFDNFGRGAVKAIVAQDDQPIAKPDAAQARRLLQRALLAKTLGGGASTGTDPGSLQRLKSLPRSELISQLVDLRGAIHRFAGPPRALKPDGDDASSRLSEAALIDKDFQLQRHGVDGKVVAVNPIRFATNNRFTEVADKAWYRWRIGPDGALWIDDIHSQPVARFVAGPAGPVGRTYTGDGLSLKPGQAAAQRPNERFWPAEWKAARVTTADIVDVTWNYRFYHPNLVYNGGRHVRFDKLGDNHGEFRTGRTDNWRTWNIHDGALRVYDKNGAFVARLQWAPIGKTLVSQTTKGDWFVLQARVERPVDSIPARFWASDLAVDKPRDKDVVGKVFAYEYLLPSGYRMGWRDITFGPKGTFSDGGSRFWHRWAIEDGHLALYNQDGQRVCTFKFSRARGRFVGWGYDGDILTLEAKNP